jgi:hypothetical protein
MARPCMCLHGWVSLRFVKTWPHSYKRSTRVQISKQKLDNGFIIPAGFTHWFNAGTYAIHEARGFIEVPAAVVNQWIRSANIQALQTVKK